MNFTGRRNGKMFWLTNSVAYASMVKYAASQGRWILFVSMKYPNGVYLV